MKKENRKAQVLAAIDLFNEENGYPPSFRDIAEYMDMAHSHVHSLVRELRADGLLHERHPKISRSVTLTRAGHQRLREYIADGVTSANGDHATPEHIVPQGSTD